MVDWIPITVIWMCVGLAVITDVRTLRVHNTLTFPLILSGLAFHTIVSGLQGLQFSFLGVAIALLVLLIPFALGAMGAGDVKLLMGLGAWLGYPATVVIALVACIVTGIYSIICLIAKGGLSEAIFNFQVTAFRMQALGKHLLNEDLPSIEEMSEDPEQKKRLIPFTVMITVGLASFFIYTNWFS